MKVMRITNFKKTAKFMIICKRLNKLNEIYLKSCGEGPSKVTRIAKITKFTKTVKVTIIRKMINKIIKI